MLYLLNYGKFDFVVTDQLNDIIMGSLKKYPRDFLITQDDNKTNLIYKDGKLKGLIQRLFITDDGIHFSFNDIRHAFETYIAQFNIEFHVDEIHAINTIIGHNSEQRDFYRRDTIRSKPLFNPKFKYDLAINPEHSQLIQNIAYKCGGFYDIGDNIVPFLQIHKIKILFKTPL